MDQLKDMDPEELQRLIAQMQEERDDD